MTRVMNFPERSLELTSAFRQKWFWMWVLLPIAAYYASWLLMTLPYPVFLVIAQWMALDHNKRKEKPNIWLWNLVIFIVTGVIVISILDNLLKGEKDNAIIPVFFGVYYGLQTLNEFLLVKVFMKWRFGYWAITNLLAALFWIGVLLVGKVVTGNQIKYEYFIGVIIPIMGIISNTITGLGIHLATQSRYGV
jgi:hypothetical protein